MVIDFQNELKYGATMVGNITKISQLRQLQRSRQLIKICLQTNLISYIKIIFLMLEEAEEEDDAIPGMFTDTQTLKTYRYSHSPIVPKCWFRVVKLIHSSLRFVKNQFHIQTKEPQQLNSIQLDIIESIQSLHTMTILCTMWRPRPDQASILYKSFQLNFCLIIQIC